MVILALVWVVPFENYFSIIQLLGRGAASLAGQTGKKEGKKNVLKMFVILVLACFPFSLPSFYLAFRLYKVRYLDSIFNQHVALMMIFSGKSSIVKTDL